MNIINKLIQLANLLLFLLFLLIIIVSLGKVHWFSIMVPLI